MNILRRLLLAFCAFVLVTASIGMAWADAGARTFRDRDTVKGWLEDSSFYDKLTPAILESIDANEGEVGQQLPIEDPALQAKVSEVLNANFLRSNTGKVLDGVYDWLEGKTAKPEFTLDLTETRTQLAAAIGSYAGERAASLPVCTALPAELDPLTTDCLPPGVAPSQVASLAESELLNNQDFLGDPIITADSIKTEENGQQKLVFDQNDTQPAQKAYDFVSSTPFLLAILCLLAAAGIIFLSSSRSAGLFRAGITILGPAVILGVTYLIMNQLPKALDNFAKSQVDSDGVKMTELISNLVNVVSRDLRDVIGMYALIFALIGIAFIVFSRLMRRREVGGATSGPQGTTPALSAHDSTPITMKDPKKTTPAEAPKPKQPPKIQL